MLVGNSLRGVRSFHCLVLFLILLAGVVSSAARADEEVRKGPAASWVRSVDIPSADLEQADRVKRGISWLMTDEQIIRSDHGYDDYSRTVYKIVDRPGLELGAGINLQFDPSRHRVTLNHLRIIRDGAVLDRLDSVKFDIFRRERDAEKGMFDGWLTAHLDVADVRVGDIIDYATTYEITPLIGRDLFFYSFSTEWDEPVGLIRVSVMWPSAQPLQIKTRGTTIKPVATPSGTDTVYLWEIRNPKPVKVEDSLPPEYPGWGTVDVASTASWQAIVDTLAPHYQPSKIFPPAFAAKLDDIAARYAMPAERMIRATRLVQDEIRYVSLSMGAGSYIPRDPATVVESGFGDCKDKALLLASALQRLGISAEVALADLDNGRALDQHLPALRNFDHAIVKASVGSRTYWLDATRDLQGGVANDFAQADYGFALPLSGRGELEKMPSPVLTSPSVRVDEQFDFPQNAGDPLSLTVFTMYEGADADSMRGSLANRSLADLTESYLKYYSKQYPGLLSAARLEINDRRDGNIISIKESYTLPAEALAANGLATKFRLQTADLSNNLPTPTSVGRAGPVYLGPSVYRRHTILISHLKARFSANQIKNVITPYLRLTSSWRNTPTTFQVSWDFQTLADTVPAAAIGDYLKSVDEVADNTAWQFDFTQVDPPPEEVKVTDPERDRLVALGGLTFLALIVIVPIFLIYEGRTFRMRPGQSYWPMSTTKFLVLSLATMGFYPAFWTWRAFRQEKLANGSRGWPWLRGLFLPVSFVPSFLNINRTLGTRRMSIGIGVVAGIVLLAAAIVEFVPNAVPRGAPMVVFSLLQILVASVAPLPMLIAANRANEPSPEFRVTNSRFSLADGIAVALGLIFTSSMLYFAAASEA